MFLWTKNIEERGKINMIQREDDEWAPLHLDDLCCSVIDIMTHEGKIQNELTRRHCHKTYTLTGPECISGKDIVGIINRVTHHRGVLDYEQVSRRDLEEYLKSLEGDDYERDFYNEDEERHLLQRECVYLLQRCLADFQTGFAELLRSSQRSLENGRNLFDEGVDRLETGINLIVRRGVVGGDIFDWREINLNGLEEVANRIKRSGIEQLQVLNSENRMIVLDEVKNCIEMLQVCIPSRIFNFNTLDHKHRRGHYPRPFLPLNRIQIDMICDYLEYIKHGNAEQTDDVHKITGQSPTSIKIFFEDNSDAFRPPRDRLDFKMNNNNNSMTNAGKRLVQQQRKQQQRGRGESTSDDSLDGGNRNKSGRNYYNENIDYIRSRL
nr:9880_t:CDS:2 [Entrophospora candida]